jgi:hypothetical protein
MSGDFFESLDDESTDLDLESYDGYSSAEFLPGLANILPTITGAVSNLFRPPVRPPLTPVSVPASGPGVTTANITTPTGTATLRLPEPAVSRHEFEQATSRLQGAVNTLTSRQNTTQTDIQNLSQRVGTVVADTRTEISKLRTNVGRSLATSQQQHRTAIRKMRSEQSSQNMMNMMMSMMQTRRLQERIDAIGTAHNDLANVASVGSTPRTSLTVPAESSDNGMMMMLPFMMMGGSSDGSSNSDGNGNMMMMMAMMMAMGS